MKYYSTNRKAPLASLQKAVVKGLAEDRGLYMPERIHKMPKEFFDNIQDMSFRDIAYNVASAFFGEDVDLDALQELVFDTLSFDCPVVKVTDHIYSLERAIHGPSAAILHQNRGQKPRKRAGSHIGRHRKRRGQRLLRR